MSTLRKTIEKKNIVTYTKLFENRRIQSFMDFEDAGRSILYSEIPAWIRSILIQLETKCKKCDPKNSVLIYFEQIYIELEFNGENIE